VREYLGDSREAALSIAESIRIQAAGNPDRCLTEVTDAVIDGLPAELGFKRIREVRVPQFSLTTVFWGLEQMRRERPAI
jgi:hypothetical protein